MTEPEFASLINRLSYKPSSRIVVSYEITRDELSARFSMTVLDSGDKTNHVIPTVCHTIDPNWLKDTDEEEVVDWVRSCWHALEIHEADEWLKLDGKAIFDPHHGENA